MGSRTNSFYVDGMVNGQLLSLLLDTGATMTILNSRTVPAEKILPTTWALRTATGEPAKVYGETVATFFIGGQHLKHRALVAEIDEDVILGMDLMIEYGIKLDMSRGVMTLGDEDVILRQGKDLSARVLLLEDTALPAQSQILTHGTIEGHLPAGQCMLLEPGRHEQEVGRGVLVARSLIKTGHTTPIRLMNLNSFPITLKKGTPIGECTAATSIVRRLQRHSSELQGLPVELKGFVEEWCRDLLPEQSKEVKNMITRWQDVFETSSGPRGRTNVVQHRIDTGDAKPIRQVPRRLPLAKREDAKKVIEEMAADGVIEPSSSPWMSPVVLVKKKDGTTRFCVDYRLLNNVTKKDSYPLPRIDDTLDTLEGCELFSTLDLRSGYWQVGLAPEDKEKTAFSIGTGLWQFTVMPFGLCNAPATFERLMENVLRGLSWEICLVYLDDIIVLGKSFTHHLENLEKVFERLRAANLKLNPKKCNLFRRQVNYLGHVVSDNGVAVDPAKIAAITNWPVPRDKHQVRSFLGLCTYYRRYVKGFANIAKPLTRLTEEKRTFHWDHECQASFEELKNKLSSAPILSYPRPEGKFVLDTDASNTAIGSVLSQIQDGEEKVIGYFSKALSAPERNYCVTRKELLAVVKSIEHFHKYLYGRRFLLRTDHAALMWLLRFKSPEGQVARWIERLQEYDFESAHRAGTSHRNADALSRRPCDEECKHCSRQEEKQATVLRTTVAIDSWQDTEVSKEQDEDPDLKQIKQWKLSGQGRPTWQDVAPMSKNIKTYWAQWDSILVDNGLLKRALENTEGDQRRLQLIIPKSKVPEVLRELHDGASGGHLGVHRTLEKARERFYWANLKDDVLDWCRRCATCAASNGPTRKKKAPMKKYNVGAPFERIAIDIAGPFPVTDEGNRYILVAMDYFSKWVEAYALPNQEAVTVADVLVKQLVSRFGVPMELHADQGRNFESSVFLGMCEILGIRKTRTTPLHPQSDGMVERMNRTMGRYLSKVVSDHQRDWDQYLHLFLLAYRSSVNETTGQTPANVLFGRELRLPCDLKFGFKPDEEVAGEDYVTNLRKRMDNIHEKVRTNIEGASDRMKERYDIKAEKGGFKSGDLVWLHNPRRRQGYSPKLQSSWDGPYVIIKRINDVIYRIRKQPKGKPKVVHFNRLAPYKGDHGAEEGQQVRSLTNNDLDAHPKAQGTRNRIQTVYRDIFSLPVDYALAHCVAEDLRTSRGIATVFRKKYAATEELERQGPSVGKALHHLHEGRHLFYLVTKCSSEQKPTYDTLRQSLDDLRSKLLKLRVTKLAIPKLGYGYDGLEWKIVRKMIEETFANSGVSILVCTFNPWKEKAPTSEEAHHGPISADYALGQSTFKEGAVLRPRRDVR